MSALISKCFEFLYIVCTNANHLITWCLHLVFLCSQLWTFGIKMSCVIEIHIFFFFLMSASSLSFMDTCSFELENICGMIQSSDDNSDWQRLSQVPAGPNTDHTNMGECKGMRKNLLSFWEVFSAEAVFYAGLLQAWPYLLIFLQTTVCFLTKQHRSTYLGTSCDMLIFCLFQRIECPYLFW